MQPGIWLVHKRAGETSFGLVRAFMEEDPKLKYCHGGALDPFATGLVLVLAGQATRLMELAHPVPKRYLVELAWGAQTDNLDPTGRVVFAGDASKLTPAAIEAALAAQLGTVLQVPPAHSNKRVGGERAYEKAWRGEVFELPPSRVHLHSARVLAHELPRATRLELVTGSGYYVRALARDLGRALGCGAHLAALWREEIGPWRDPGPGRRELSSGRALLPWLAYRDLDAAEAKAVKDGKPIARGEVKPGTWRVPAGFPAPGGPVRGILGEKLVALFAEEGGLLRPVSNLRGGL